MMTKFYLFMGLLVTSSLLRAAPVDYQISDSQTQFNAIGRPSLVRIKGEGQGPSGPLSVNDKKVTGDLKVDLNTFKTGIETRDDHMKNKYLEVKTFPEAKLSLSNFELTQTPSLIKEKISDKSFTGVLTLHGVSKPVEGKYEIEPSGKNLKVKATYSIVLSDYKIDIPTYMGIKVADKVDIEVNFSLTPSPQKLK